MLTCPCVSVQGVNHLAEQPVFLSELFAKFGGLFELHLGVQRPRKRNKSYNVFKCVTMCTLAH